jgi:hypothetical protein
MGILSKKPTKYKEPQSIPDTASPETVAEQSDDEFVLPEQVPGQSDEGETGAGESGTEPGKQYKCEYCDETFDDGAAKGRHMGSKHRKDIAARKEREHEMKRTGLDIIAKVTGGLSEQEFIGQNGEEGFEKLKEAWLEKLLSTSPINSKTVEYVMTMYRVNRSFQNNYQELSSLISSAGVNERVKGIIMKGLMSWEEEAIGYLDEALGGSGSGYYGMGGRRRRPQGMYADESFGRNRGTGNEDQSWGGRPGMGRRTPRGDERYSYGDDRPLTAGDAMAMFRNMMDDKRKQDELTILRQKVDSIPQMVQKILQDNLGGRRRGSGGGQGEGDEPECEIEVVLKGPDGKPLLDGNGNAIKTMRRIPISRMETMDDVSKQPVDVRQIIRDEITRIKTPKEEDAQIRELKEQAKIQTERYEELKDELKAKDKEMFEKQLAAMQSQIEKLSSNVGDYKNDMYRLAATSVDRLSKQLDKREPLSKLAAKFILKEEGIQLPPGESAEFIELSNKNQLPVEHRSKIPKGK